MSVRRVVLGVVTAVVISVGVVFPAAAGYSPDVGVTTLAGGLELPWGFGFLPDGSAVFTERDTFKIRMMRDGQVSDIQVVPGVVSGGDGGLLGLAVSPHYAADNTIFVYYTAATDNRIAKVVLGQPPVPILTGIPKGPLHNGGSLAFGPDGYLYAGTGDANVPAGAQDLSSLAGKILRITTEGTAPPGNPFPGSPVYSSGHRNSLGLAWGPHGRLYASELGQDTWDELNAIHAGGNYGWPECEGRCATGGFTDPARVWHPAEASPGGLAYHRGSLYMTGLRGARLWKIPVTRDGDLRRPQERWRGSYGRLRAVVTTPDGMLWVATGNRDGKATPAVDDDRILSTTDL